MAKELSCLLKRHFERIGISVSRISNQTGIPKQTLFNWCDGRTPRWHTKLPSDLLSLARALGLNSKEAEELLLAAGCACALDTPTLDESIMESLTMPHGWHRAGSRPRDYEMGIDPNRRQNDSATATLRWLKGTDNGFGTLMQSCLPGEFLEKRVRLSAMICSEDIAAWAGLWFRIDGPMYGESLNFDNMQDRPIEGTTDWTRHSVVLDVQEVARAMAYGVLLCGQGRLWISDVRIEIVDSDVPSTNLGVMGPGRHPEPVNLDFSE